ncbi:uncharacterized protein LOC119314233 [Triticum dicoccoides]|uniref:Uncharacterized protein n=2 Tax=Triticum TaxID=4564 RepID=A0A9R0VFY6_TRITD|nr:uncharacterized protein LOC119314233 [Triticum dicoccoides]XP_044379099.1 uncharacterized protein LOC123101919 [Triticum aestivum]VAH23967.1 unnamed protein product [Triticum turgidum subsp. durum]
MAAAMRFGGGALLRRAPVAAARVRLAHTKPCSPEEMRDAAARVAEIDKAKEELFDKVHGMVTTYDVPRRMSREYMLLMQRLSSQINPRPQDPIWRFCRRHERRNTYYKFLGACTNGLLTGVGIGLLVFVPPKKSVADWWNKVTS